MERIIYVLKRVSTDMEGYDVLDLEMFIFDFERVTCTRILLMKGYT